MLFTFGDGGPIWDWRTGSAGTVDIPQGTNHQVDFGKVRVRAFKAGIFKLTTAGPSLDVRESSFYT